MAFGDKSRQMGERAKKREANGGEVQSFTAPWIPLGGTPRGTVVRIFHWLPELDGNDIKFTERLSPTSGLPLREGNKKTGKPLMQPVPAAEKVFSFAWWTVTASGNQVQRRLILDPDVWKNPLRQHILDVGYDKASKEYKAIKTAFAANVFDVTPVAVTSDGRVFYSSGSTFNVLSGTPNGKIITDKDKLPTDEEMANAAPLKQVRIIEGSYGKPGGKHLFAQFEDLNQTTEDGDGLFRNLSEFDIKLTVTGVELDTKRSVRNQPRFYTPDVDIARLPRYDLDKWLNPWPDELIERLLEGEDYDELLEEYGINPYPQLKAEAHTERLNTEDVEEEELFDS